MDKSSSEDSSSDMEIGGAEAAKNKNETEMESQEVEKTSKQKNENDSDSVDGSGTDSDESDCEYECNVCNKKFSGYIPFRQHEKGNKHAKALQMKKREKKLLDKIKDGEKGVEDDEEYLLFMKKPFAVCKPCGKQFGNAESYHLHRVSKAHKQKKIEAAILDEVRENGEINVEKLKEYYKSKKTNDDAEDLLEDDQEGIASLTTDEFECRDCEKAFSGLVPYSQHLMSKTHARKIKQNKLMANLKTDASEDLQYSAKSNFKDISTLVVEDDILVCKLCSTSFSGPESAMIHLKSNKHAKKLEKQINKMKKRQKAEAEAEAEAEAAKVSNSSEEDSDDESEDHSDSENVKDTVEDKELPTLSKTAASKDERSSTAKNVGEEKKDADVKDKDNERLKDEDNPFLARESYTNYKKMMSQAKEKNEST